MLHNSVFKDDAKTPAPKKAAIENSDDTTSVTTTTQSNTTYYETKAQSQLQLAVVIFLLSWTPYVAESIFSSYFQISPIVGIISACIPVFSTSLLPVLFMESLRDETPPRPSSKSWDGVVVVQ